MILGMSLATVTQIHVIFSLIGIVSGSRVVLLSRSPRAPSIVVRFTHLLPQVSVRRAHSCI